MIFKQDSPKIENRVFIFSLYTPKNSDCIHQNEQNILRSKYSNHASLSVEERFITTPEVYKVSSSDLV